MLAKHINAPEEARGRMASTHDAAIRRHESRARITRRRASHARAGLVLYGELERNDAEWVREHGELARLAHRTRRVHWED